MKAARSQQHPRNQRAARPARPSSDELLSRQLQELMLEDEWNSSWEELPSFDDRNFRTVDED